MRHPRFRAAGLFTFNLAERTLIDARRGHAHKRAFHIGFLRISGWLLDGFRIVLPMLWRHLCIELGIDAPELVSRRSLYRRGRAIFDRLLVACEALGFRWMRFGS